MHCRCKMCAPCTPFKVKGERRAERKPCLVSQPSSSNGPTRELLRMRRAAAEDDVMQVEVKSALTSCSSIVATSSKETQPSCLVQLILEVLVVHVKLASSLGPTTERIPIFADIFWALSPFSVKKLRISINNCEIKLRQ